MGREPTMMTLPHLERAMVTPTTPPAPAWFLHAPVTVMLAHTVVVPLGNAW